MSVFSSIFKGSKASALSYSEGLRNYMLGVYNYMSFGLFLSAFLSFFAWQTGFVKVIVGTPLGLVLSIAPIGFVMYMGVKFESMKLETAKMLFIAYAACFGLSISTIFLSFGIDTIVRAFFITSSMFLAMSIYGYTTKADLSGYSSYFTMMLFGLLISSLLNIFFKSSVMSNVISLISVVVFTALTAYDTQQIKEVYYNANTNDSKLISKIAVMGALRLYMDFVAMFIHILHLLSAFKDNNK
jgi:FtsH-binding integral membrane protein